MKFIKLKDDVDFKILKTFGFQEDEANCEFGDSYYHLNNYYIQVNKDFRITVNTNNRHIDILCLAEEHGLYNIFNLKPLYDLISIGITEVVVVKE